MSDEIKFKKREINRIRFALWVCLSKFTYITKADLLTEGEKHELNKLLKKIDKYYKTNDSNPNMEWFKCLNEDLLK